MHDDIKDSFFTKAAAIFLYLALVAYPFSIAGASLFFGLLVLMTLIQTEIMKQGLRIFWYDYKPIAIGILLLFLITVLGYFWSDNTSVAQHKIIKQFNWLILPAIVGLHFFVPSIRERGFAALSIGLFLHLIVCTCQYYGIITINGQGSSKADPTGFLGHLYFGFVYAIWVGGLIIAAQRMSMPWRLCCYVLACYALIIIFMAQGRSGYILALVIMALVFLRATFHDHLKYKIILLLSFTVILSIFFTMHATSKRELERTVKGIEAYFENNWSHVDPRIRVWATGLEVYKEHPFIGVGTGDYKEEAKKTLSKPEFNYLRKWLPDVDHPHNEFLFALVRWGPIGLAVVLFLCWAWVSTGWKKDWQNDTMNAYLMTSSGLGIIVLGLTDSSLNSKLSLMFSIVILSFSMLKAMNNKKCYAPNIQP